MWGAFGLILVLLTAGHIWMARNATRQTVESQEAILKMVKGRTIDDVIAKHPDFLPTFKSWSDEMVRSALDVMDDKQAQDLKAMLDREDL